LGRIRQEQMYAPRSSTRIKGCQFTSLEFTSILKQHGIAISMDGKGRWRDNVFVERLWKSVKYEEVYLRAYETVSAARSGLARYFQFYNTRRPHSALDRPHARCRVFRSAARSRWQREPQGRPLIGARFAVQVGEATSVVIAPSAFGRWLAFPDRRSSALLCRSWSARQIEPVLRGASAAEQKLPRPVLLRSRWSP